jgi:hypothetical protein
MKEKKDDPNICFLTKRNDLLYIIGIYRTYYAIIDLARLDKLHFIYLICMRPFCGSRLSAVLLLDMKLDFLYSKMSHRKYLAYHCNQPNLRFYRLRRHNRRHMLHLNLLVVTSVCQLIIVSSCTSGSLISHAHNNVSVT